MSDTENGGMQVTPGDPTVLIPALRSCVLDRFHPGSGAWLPLAQNGDDDDKGCKVVDIEEDSLSAGAAAAPQKQLWHSSFC